ncbi:hypothetical protein GCM10009679_10100 [Saccharothrix algeriensis]|uniref:Uncharacterized protein n=1 Tax=Catellatospora bangladeshensis TaxID=310355 RepID=A0A8J3NK52_9ACTN|nr:hypothetical protein Cba03nite_35750 [Catellatospora bangladeshensis]
MLPSAQAGAEQATSAATGVGAAWPFGAETMATARVAVTLAATAIAQRAERRIERVGVFGMASLLGKLTVNVHGCTGANVVFKH